MTFYRLSKCHFIPFVKVPYGKELVLICYYLTPGELYTYKISLLSNIIAHNNTHQPPQQPRHNFYAYFKSLLIFTTRTLF